MPIKLQQGFDPLAYYGRREDGWRLKSVFAQDGLNPTQVVRFFEAAEGIDFAEGTAQPFRIDATANADDKSNPTNVTTDEHRYVVNPQVLKHQFGGLWTGGAARWGTNPQTQKRTIEQTLTRTWPAGHGYLVDEQGNYVVVWKDSTGAGFHIDGPGGTPIPVDADLVQEYATAKAALMSHRPSLASRFSSYMAFREDIPGTYWREIVWRDFTHESIPFIEALKDSPSDVQDIVEYHFGSRVAGDVEDLTTNVDKDTNTVYVKCILRLRDLGEPSTADELMALPFIEAPCTRETLRMFGLNFLADGEGYKFTHTYRWPGLKDSATTRALLEWVTDSTILPKLRAADYTADAPALLASADGTGRFYTEQTQVPDGTGTEAVKCRVPWWRIALQKLDEDKTEDGALAFTIVITKPEWHGSELKPHVHTGSGNPLGWGQTETRVIPSVPRADATRVMEGVESPDHRLVSRLSQSERADGDADVSYDLRRVFDYDGTGDENDLPPGTQPVDGIAEPTVEHSQSPGTGRQAWVLHIPAVNPESVGTAIDGLRAKLAAVGARPTKVDARLGADRAYEITVYGSGSRPTVIRSWLSAVEWFDHTKETLLFGYRLTDIQTDADGREYVLPLALDDETGEPYIDPQTNWWAFDANGDKIYLGGWLDASWEDPYDPSGDTDNDAADKLRTHALTREQRSVNDDGSFDSRLTEETPHKRYWTWEDQESRGRKTRTVKHEVWRNWPSRKALAADIVGTNLGTKQVDVSISINKYGLVDATRTEAPAWRSVSVAQGATFTEDADVTWTELEKAYRKPGSSANLSDTPAEGYYWRLVEYTANIGRTSGGATDATQHMNAAAVGTSTGKPGPGSKVWPERQNNVDTIGSVWAWKCVTSVSPGTWSDQALVF